jgi:crotonobetainyl-CoA:carnitine CoA-transferase CaiB-like acyl-CoA transferase
MWHRTGFIDFQCGLASLVATLLALYHRLGTGEGQFVAASLLGGAIQSMSDVFALPDGSLSPAPRLDANQTGVSPFDRIYQCNDRYWIAVLAETNREQQALLDAFDARTVNELAEQVARYSQDHALYKSSQAGVAAVAVQLNGKDLFYESRVNQEAGLTVKNRHALFGDLEQPGLYWYMAETALITGPAPPAIGEHTREICRQFGLSDEVYSKLAASGQVLSMTRRDGGVA